MAEPYTTVDLWDGAFTAELPQAFRHISDMVQAADHQEIFLDAAPDISLIIELTRRVPCADESLEPADYTPDEHRSAALSAAARDDIAAFRHHLADLTADDTARGGTLHDVQAPAAVEPAPGCPWATYSCVAHMAPPAHQPPSSRASEGVKAQTLAMALVRYVTRDGDLARASDVLVTVCVRHAAEAAGEKWRALYGPEMSPVVARVLEVRARFVRSLRLNDYALFGED